MGYTFRNTSEYNLKEIDNKVIPEVPLRIQNFYTGKFININALVDTGSETCVLPEYIATALGYKLNKESRKPRGVKGVSGTEIETHVFGFRINLLDDSERQIVRTLDVVCNVVRTPALRPILGTKNFNDQFSIEFDYLTRKLRFRW